MECDGVKDITFIEAKIVKSTKTERRTLPPKERQIEHVDCIEYQMVPPFSQRGNETEIYLCYTLKHLRGGPIDLALHESRSIGLNSTGALPANNQIFHQAVLSFATIFFGSRHRQTCITNNGYTMLGGTLRRLNQALSEVDCHAHDEIVLSVVTLALLESFVPTGPNHFLQHMLGLEKLIELRGPDAYRDPRSVQLLRGMRHMVLFASLRTRKPSILARPEWKKVLRATCSEKVAQEEDLFDVIADCTVLLSDRDSMLADVNSGSEKTQREQDKIARKALVLLDFLYSWKERWNGDSANLYFTRTAPSILSSAQDSPPNEAPFSLAKLEFLNDFATTTFMLYNTALICILQILTSLTSGAPESQISKHTAAHNAGNTFYSLQKQINDEHIAAERVAALDICSCLPYLVRKSCLGSRVVHLAVTTAWTALGGDRTVEGRWIRSFLNPSGQEFIAKGLWIGDVKDNLGLVEH